MLKTQSESWTIGIFVVPGLRLNGPNPQAENLRQQVGEVAVEIEVAVDTEEEVLEVLLPEAMTVQEADLLLLVVAVLLPTDVAVLLLGVVLLPLET